MNDLLAGRGIHKSYINGKKTLHVLNGIDVLVKSGESLFIVGPSGAGKSTLLHILAGLDRPDRGNVIIDGADIYRLSDRERSRLKCRRIGFVFQFYHLLGEFSALENVMLPGIIAGKSRPAQVKQKAAGLLSRMGLSARFSHRPSELSGGEQQRVAIARALVNSPDMLFCDEPTGNLDSKTGRAVYDLLFELNENDRIALVVVTHQKEYGQRAQRCLGIKDGILSS